MHGTRAAEVRRLIETRLSPPHTEIPPKRKPDRIRPKHKPERLALACRLGRTD
jgi:hypothetical protein